MNTPQSSRYGVRVGIIEHVEATKVWKMTSEHMPFYLDAEELNFGFTICSQCKTFIQSFTLG